MLLFLYSPINAGDVNDNIYHITAELISLHVHWGTVCCNINFTDYIKEKGFLNSRILQGNRENIDFTEGTKSLDNKDDAVSVHKKRKAGEI